MAAVRDARAFERIYDEHLGTVYLTALRVLGDPAQAQDVAQDVFLKLWHQPERFDASRGSLVNYLKLMARSRALDLWRERDISARARERMKVIARRDEGRADERPVVAAELRRDRAIVQRAVAVLPDPQRQAIVMAYWGGLTAEQIARRCQVPVGTVKSRLRLALIKMRESCGPGLVRGEITLAA